jgi:hypothetical protein
MSDMQCVQSLCMCMLAGQERALTDSSGYRYESSTCVRVLCQGHHIRTLTVVISRMGLLACGVREGTQCMINTLLVHRSHPSIVQYG